jgi:hypothetical protein
MPINPDSMSSPHQDRQISTSYGTRYGVNRLRSFVTPSPAKEWTWGGVIRSEAHYDALLAWVKKPGKVRVTDHLGRTFEVFIQAFEPEDRKPTPQTPWRLRYTVTTLLLRRIS